MNEKQSVTITVNWTYYVNNNIVQLNRLQTNSFLFQNPEVETNQFWININNTIV